jgi:hypothetical protein
MKKCLNFVSKLPGDGHLTKPMGHISVRGRHFRIGTNPNGEELIWTRPVPCEVWTGQGRKGAPGVRLSGW